MKSKVNKDALWKMAMAFQISKALFVASELNLFTLLSKKPASAEHLARKLKLHTRPVARLLNSMVAFGLLKKRNEKFSNTEIASTFLVKGNRAYFQVGGAIVYDSDPEAEYQETLDKARALIDALNVIATHVE